MFGPQRIYKCRGRHDQLVLNQSQSLVGGYSFEAFQSAHVLIGGGGAVGSHVAHGMAGKGIGCLTVLDDDRIDAKNLTRQRYSTKSVGKYKAFTLGRDLTKSGLFRLRVIATSLRFQEIEHEEKLLRDATARACLGDNNALRTAMCREALAHNRPVVFAGLSRDALSLYCAVQEPGKACLACMLPHVVNDDSYPCGVAGSIDVTLVASGLVIFALDTLITGRYRGWSLRTLYLDGSIPDRVEEIPRRTECALCGENTGGQ